MADIHTYDYSNDQISAAGLTAQKRQAIAAVAGDIHSIQGTIADSTQVTMLVLGQLLLQLKAGKAIDEIIASDPAFTVCTQFAQAEADGHMKMPFKQKPAGEALKDMTHRTNAVAELYAQ